MSQGFGKHDFPTGLSREVRDMVIGRKLDRGAARHVYECAYDPSLVVKIENRQHSFQNVMEWTVWTRMEHYQPIAEWLAPCVSISGTGIILLQKKTVPVRPEDFPDKLPAWMTDLKMSNFGWLEGRLVLHDYGNHLLMEKGCTKQLRSIKIRDDGWIE